MTEPHKPSTPPAKPPTHPSHQTEPVPSDQHLPAQHVPPPAK